MDLIRNARYQLLTFYPALILCLMVANFSFGELIGYWNLNDANEAQDSSGNNNHGKIEGKPKSVAGKIKTALENAHTPDLKSIMTLLYKELSPCSISYIRDLKKKI